MKREDLLNTKWDVRKWTNQERNDFLYRVEPLGFLWYEVHEHPKNVNFFYLEDGRICYGYCGDNFRNIAGFVEKHYTDMFPEETPAPQFTQEDIIQYIVDQVEERKSVDESGEDERGFEGLVYVEPPFEDTMTYYVVEKSSCSEEQWQFLLSNLQITNGSCGKEGTLQNCGDGDGWFDNDEIDYCDVKTTFNDLFKYKEDL